MEYALTGMIRIFFLGEAEQAGVRRRWFCIIYRAEGSLSGEFHCHWKIFLCSVMYRNKAVSVSMLVCFTKKSYTRTSI